MREILFRIWHKIHQRMYENIYEINFYNGIVGYIIDDYSSLEQRIEDVSFDDCVIMQFTGLTDKNGTKIFKDDLLSTKERDVLFQVVWDNESCGFKFKSIETGTLFEIDSSVEKLEVIGNIHEKGK